MTRFEAKAFEDALPAQRNQISGEMLFELGLAYSTGRNGITDLVTAHKWFNIAAMRGKLEAARYRAEIARELNAMEIAEAQRAAREWLDCA